MNDQKELDQLRDEYVEAKMTSMRDDGDGTELEFYAKQGLEAECNTLTFKELEELMIELAEWNGDFDEAEEEE
jgi:hypothetical protein